MKTFLTALMTAAFGLASGSALAQQDKSEPTKVEAKKVEAKKVEKASAKKDEGKKKVKKGGC